MTTGYFAEETNLAALRAECAAWKGTPFAAHSAIIGAGGDCVRTAAAIYQAVGAIGPIDWPRYRIHGEEAEYLLARMDACPGLVRTASESGANPNPGDCLVGKAKDGVLHIAIHEGEGFIWHMSRRLGWCRRHVQVARRAWELVAVYRPAGAGQGGAQYAG